MRRLIRELLLPVMVVLGLAFAIQAAVAKPYVVPTGSMIPTIGGNDHIIVNRFVYRFRDIARGDIVVFTPPKVALDSCDAPGGGCRSSRGRSGCRVTGWRFDAAGRRW